MDDINVSFTPLKDWNSLPEWKAMDPTLKGFFSQLLLVASFNKPAGYIPDDDKLWRKWLGIPSKTFDEQDYNNFEVEKSEVAKTIKKYFDTDNSKNIGISSAMLEALESIWDEDESLPNKKKARLSYDSWINYLWCYQWKPALEKCLVKIDVKLRIQFEEFEGYEGFFFPLAYSMANIGKEVSVMHKAQEKPKKNTRKKGKKTSLPLPNILEVEALTMDDIGYDGLLWLNADNSPLTDLTKVLRVWRTPISSQKRKNIWDIGVACLENSPSNYGKARAFLGKMIKKFSEEKVSRTVAEMARKPSMGLDPYALFTTIINSYEYGTLKEQKARAERTTVSL